MPLDVGYVFAGLMATNRDRAAAWYEQLFGRPPDMLPNEHEAAWQLTPNASLYLVVDTERAGQGVVTLIVDDLDATLLQIGERGIAAARVEQVGSAGRKATIADPDGNSVAIVELAASTRGEVES